MMRNQSSDHSTPATSKLLVALLIGVLPLPALPGGSSLVRNVEYVFKADKYAKTARLASLTARDLRNASKVDNVNALLELAANENRIDPIQMMQLSRGFTEVTNGDQMLLLCLQNEKCSPKTFFEIANSSRLHAEVIKRNPALGPIQAHHVVGELNEHLMTRYFEHTGWTRINGQIGRTGIDGLFIKRRGKVMAQVLVAEGKYNTSSLQSTNFGVQMSDEWVRRKMVELKQRFPNESVYQEIDEFIKAGAYRAVLWDLRVEEAALKIGINEVTSNGARVDIARASSTEIANLSSPFTNRIELKSPRNSFEEQVLGWYNHELAAVGPLPFR